MTAHPRRLRSDAGVVLVTSLVKLVLVLGILGVVGYDSFSVLVGQYRVRDDAATAARAGSDALHATGRQSAAYAAVSAFAQEHGDVVVRQGPTTTPDGRRNAWFVELRRDAHTLVTSYVPGLKNYVVAQADSTASDPL
ncbi:MAG: hypothetical protein GC157_10835 [Frankiales bacterium]|nr:hypothetical protein [Frankiales bacterium]